MKKHITLYLVFVLINTICFASKDDKSIANKENYHSKMISGKVVDVLSKEEIAGAEIIIAGKKVYTDLSGNFSITIDPSQNNEAIIKYVSYKDAAIKINSYLYSTLVIEITPQ